MQIRTWFILTVGCVITSAGGSTFAQSAKEWTAAQLPELIKVYRHFHENPELSLHESETGATLAAELKKAGWEVTTGVGKTGVVGVLKNGPGKTLLLRTDLDALPVTEQTGLVYSSRKRVKTDKGVETGVMHACGHDVHMTNLIAVARYCAANKDLWSGTLIALGQPAEEIGAGAELMLKDGLFEKFPKPDFALALHCDATLAAGKVGWRKGYATAYVDSVDIVMKGKGGHGAWPHTTIDPIVMGAKLVLDLQTIVSREQNPHEPAVVTVGAIHAGTKHNIISDECLLQLTVRSQTPEARKKILAAITRKAQAAAAGSGAGEPTITVSDGTPAMFNDEKLVDRVLVAFKAELGEESVVQRPATMGGEDFSRYGLAGVPIFMFNLGTVEKSRLAKYERVEQPPPSLHSPLYYPDVDETLPVAIRATIAGVKELLPKNAK